MAEYYLDVDFASGTLTGTLNFTNGSKTVTGTGTSFTTELQVGDYIRSTDSDYGGTWYKVTAITDDTTLTIQTAFQEQTHTATAEYNRGDGSQANPFCHIQQFLTDITLSPGDVLYCQLGQTLQLPYWVKASYDGTPLNPIRLIGSDWKITGTTEQYFTIDYMDKDGAISLDNDFYYYIQRIHFTRRSSTGFACLRCDSSQVILEDCKFSESAYAIDCYTDVAGFVIAKNCYFLNISQSCFKSGHFYADNCTFDNSYPGDGANILTVNCSVINYTPGTTVGAGLRPHTITHIGLSGLDLSAATSKFSLQCKASARHPYFQNILSMEDQKYSFIFNARIEGNTGLTFSNGNEAIKVIPVNAVSSPLFPSLLAEYQLLLATGTYTVTILAQSSGFSTPPTADELKIVVYAPNETGTYDIYESSSGITENDTETPLTCQFSVGDADRKVFIKVLFGKYDIDNEAYILIENGFTIE